MLCAAYLKIVSLVAEDNTILVEIYIADKSAAAVLVLPPGALYQATGTPCSLVVLFVLVACSVVSLVVCC